MPVVRHITRVYCSCVVNSGAVGVSAGQSNLRMITRTLMESASWILSPELQLTPTSASTLRCMTATYCSSTETTRFRSRSKNTSSLSVYGLRGFPCLRTMARDIDTHTSLLSLRLHTKALSTCAPPGTDRHPHRRCILPLTYTANGILP